MYALPPAAEDLSSRCVPYRVFRHLTPIDSLEQAANERNQAPEQVVRSIVFRLGAGNFVMMLVAGSEQISWPLLRSYLGQSRMTMASDEEVFEVTGYRVGAVTPFGISNPIRILADHNVFIHDEISIGSGERGTAILLKSADLRSNIQKLEIGHFVLKR